MLAMRPRNRDACYQGLAGTVALQRHRLLSIPFACLTACLLALPGRAGAQIEGVCEQGVDQKPRIALVSAFSGEADRYIEEMQREDAKNRLEGCVVLSGYRFTKGVLRGKSVVVLLTNASIVNATMATQMLLDHWNITHLIFSGIAGGIGGLGANDDDPNTPNQTPIGSVSIPERWGFHQETHFGARRSVVPCSYPALQLNHVLQRASQEALTCEYDFGEVREPGKANERAVFAPDAKNSFLRNTNVSSARTPQFYLDADGVQRVREVPFPNSAPSENDQDLRFWFPVDRDMLQIARSIDVKLAKCVTKPDGECQTEPLDPTPHVVVGKNGVSGSAFIDNADYRKWLARTLNFDELGLRSPRSDVLVADMETTAAAMVALTNGTPFLAVRSVSDLAGADDASAAAELKTFFAIAAENQARVVLAILEQLKKTTPSTGRSAR